MVLHGAARQVGAGAGGKASVTAGASLRLALGYSWLQGTNELRSAPSPFRRLTTLAHNGYIGLGDSLLLLVLLPVDIFLFGTAWLSSWIKDTVRQPARPFSSGHSHRNASAEETPTLAPNTAYYSPIRHGLFPCAFGQQRPHRRRAGPVLCELRSAVEPPNSTASKRARHRGHTNTSIVISEPRPLA